MSLHVWHGRRKVFFVIGAIAAGGYVSYRVYSSEYISRKRKQISGFVQSFSRLCEVLTDGADSAAFVFGDLKAFLLSEEDDIPQSLKQACKIAQSREFQLGIASLSQGMFLGMSGRLHTCKEEENTNIINERQEIVTDTVYCVDHDYRISAENSDNENAFLSKNGCSFKEWLINRKVSDNETHKCVKPLGDYRDSQEGLLERLMEKLFSERGKGFASAVVGSVARNFASSILEVMKFSNKVEQKRDFMTHCTLDQQTSDMYLPKENSKSCSTISEKFINFASDRKAKTLIAECIEVFVATAVSVFLDKTKDINVYEDLVAGLTKPSHQAPVKELLRFVCSGAVDTLVRTSHEVLSRRPEYEHSRSDHQQKEQGKEHGVFAVNSENGILKVDIGNMDAKEGNPIRRCRSSEFVHKQDDDSSIKAITVLRADLDGVLDSQNASASISPSTCDSSDLCKSKDTKEIFLPQLQDSRITATGQHEGGSLSFVDGLSKALAVPNIRKLVIEVAGAITFQAVQSFFDVILAIFKPVHDGQAREHRHAGALSLLNMPCFKVDKLMHIAQIIAANSLVAVTLWLAVVMHMISGVLECI